MRLTTACTQLSARLSWTCSFILLIIAGSETTRNAVSLGLLALLDHPVQLEHLRRVPGAIPLAVEEILRWSSPVSCFARRATRDTEIRGLTIAEGDRVTMWYPSANRDSDVFADPFRFDIARSPNPHLAFGGGGVHFCLGASLARRELTTLIEVLLERTRHIELIGDPSYTSLGILNPILISMRELLPAFHDPPPTRRLCPFDDGALVVSIPTLLAQRRRRSVLSLGISLLQVLSLTG